MSKIAIILPAILFSVILSGCSFGEYSQSVDLPENIDDYRTGCEIDSDVIMAEYKQYEANESYVDWSFGDGDPDPTPTPGPVTSSDLGVKAVLLEDGCLAGRTDAVGAEQATSWA